MMFVVQNCSMELYKRGSYMVWDCKYYFVWIMKYRYQVLGGDVGQRCCELICEIVIVYEMVIYVGFVN